MKHFHITQAAVIKYGRIFIFLLLLVVEIVLAVNNRINWYWIVPAIIVLTAENAVKTWALKSFRSKIICYVIDTIALIWLTYFSTGTLISTIYIIILSEFYLSQENMPGNIAMYVASSVLFVVAFALKSVFNREDVIITELVTKLFNDLLLLGVHFLIFNFTVQIYRKNSEITKTVEELSESNLKLQKAYDDLQEITALEERQRIAKDIHDTAGHSITTVIMQTEAAKLVIDTDKEDAKRKIAAANLQAKHALEELRESVHLLSGTARYSTLQDEITSIIQDSTDGTGIAVRSDVDDIYLCDAKHRFVCNTLKEGIANGLRHGGATAFYFELKKEGRMVTFLLSDNGTGVDIDQLKEGFGLSGMHARAESLGGDVWFVSEPDEGFEIHMVLPADNTEGGKL